MESWEVLRDAIDRIGAKALAADLNLSAALVYKWCQPAAPGGSGASGALNPLDRLRSIYDATGDARVINWLCQCAGGFFAPNPRVRPGDEDRNLFTSTQRMVEDFGQMLATVSRSFENDGKITREEADQIRQAWENLKSQAESFVLACEQGFFGQSVGGTR